MKKYKKYYAIIATLLCVVSLISLTPLMATGGEDAADTIDINTMPPMENAGGPGRENNDENAFIKTDPAIPPTEDAGGDGQENSRGDVFTRFDLTALLTQDTDETVRENGDERTYAKIDLATLPAESAGGVGWEFDGEKTFIITDDVIIEGETVNPGGLIFEIYGGYTVIWDAYCSEITETHLDALITVKGSGAFEVAQNGKIIRFGTGSVIKADEDIVVIIRGEIICGNYGKEEDIETACIDAMDVVVIGGKVSINGGLNRCIAIKASGNVLVADGEVTGGGIVEAQGDGGCTAILSEGDVTVISGSIYTDGPYGTAIFSDNEIQIEVSGNSVIAGQGAASNAIEAKQAAVTVKDISCVAVPDILTFANGQLWGNAITAGNVTVSDNATIQAVNGAAILYSGELNIEGGALFAYGDGIGGAYFEISEDIEEEPELDIMMNVIFKTENLDIEKGVEYIDSSDASTGITGSAIALAWDFAEYWKKRDENDSTSIEPFFIYAQDEKTDIITYPGNDADYGWGPSDRQCIQLWFGNDDNYSFFTVLYDKINKPLKPNQKREPADDSDSGSEPDSITGIEPEDGQGVESKTTENSPEKYTVRKTNAGVDPIIDSEDSVAINEVNPQAATLTAGDSDGKIDGTSRDGDPSVAMAAPASVPITSGINKPDTFKDKTASEKHKFAAEESEPAEPAPSKPEPAEPIAVFSVPEAQAPRNSRISQFNTPLDMSLLMLVSAVFGVVVMLGGGMLVLYSSVKRRRKALPEIFRANKNRTNMITYDNFSS